MNRARLRAALSALALATAASTALAGTTAAVAAEPRPLVSVPALAPLSTELAAAASSLPATTPYGAFVHFDGGSAGTRAALLADHGLTVASDYATVDVAYATGTLGAILGLRGETGVTYLEANRKLQYFGDTAPWATRARVAQTAVGSGPYRDGSGQVLDGTGVGVAVIDSGVDGLHPDLADHLGKSYKVVCSTPGLISTATEMCFGPMLVVDSTQAPYNDVSGGHGTHVSGIAVGDGTASNGTYKGVAPNATLYSYSVGEAISVLFSVEAFNDIITNYDSFSPRIKVINNSWGNAAGTPYDAASIQSKLVRQLVGLGVSVVFAAGNGDDTGDGGNGSDDRMSSTAKDPTPGVVTAANYDDGGTASRAGVLNSSSSRGQRGVPTAYPDLSAPGTSIIAACNPTHPVCATGPTPEWAPRYANLTGTSMASPHIAGAIALLYQARPDLTPAQVEDVLQDTAHRFGDASTYEADPQNAGGLTSFDKGAGLLDVPAALDALGVAADGRETSPEPTVALTSPGEGGSNDGTAPLAVTGSAYDGTVAPAPATVKALVPAGDDDLPAPAPGSADLRSLSVLEEAGGLRFTVGVRDVDDVSPVAGSSFRLYQNVDGKAFITSVSLTATGVAASAFNATGNNAVATEVTRDLVTNTVSFLLPWAAVGNPSAGSIASNPRVLGYVGSVVDQLPGGLGYTFATAPEFGSAYTVRRSGSVAPAAPTATLAVDGGPETPVTVTGASPDYGFTGSLPTDGLADGVHTLVARLYLGGVLKATDTTAFTVARPRVITSSAAITSPAEGATVAGGVVDVTGTTASDADAAVERTVTLQVSGNGYDSGPVAALGTSSWSLPVDFGALAPGSYELTARLLLDGVAAATATRSVVVTAPPVLVSCAPQALRFWQDEYSASRRGTLTAGERDALAAKAAELSSGWFGSGSAVVTALYVKGKVPAQQTAAQQYAVLLLDLAGGQLSAGYSRQVGLSGSEQLDPAVYDTARLGTTVGSAAQWVRSQLPSGDHAGAESVAGSIARGTGLTC